MEQIPKTVRERLQAAKPVGTHPDPNLLSAFVERTLADRERGPILEHLASCVDCRDIVALAGPSADAVVLRPEPKPILSWPVLRWASVAAGVVVIAGAVGLYEVHAPTRHEIIAAQTAANEPQPPASTTPFLKPKTDILASQHRVPESRVLADRFAPAPQSPAEKRDEDALAAPARAPVQAQAQNERKKEAKRKLEVAPASDASVAEIRTDELDDKVAQNQPSSDTYSARAKDGRTATASAAPAAMGNLMAKQAGAQPSVVTARKAQGTVPRWALTSDGTLERSTDSGKTWTPIVVSDGLRFQAVAAVDTDIWVGGKDGALFHSNNAGEQWARITPAAGAQSLTSDIVSIEFSDATHLRVTTSDHQNWLTDDAGQTWALK